MRELFGIAVAIAVPMGITVAIYAIFRAAFIAVH